MSKPSAKGERPRNLPAIVWLWAGAFFFVAITAYAEFTKHFQPPPSEAFYAYNHGRLVDFAAEVPPRGERPIQVVALGNSRLKHATFDDQAFSELASTTLGKPVRFLRIIENWATFENFAPLSDDLLALRPDVILLQLDLLHTNRGEAGRRVLVKEYLTWRMFGFGPWNARRLDHRALQFMKPCSNIKTPESLEERLVRTSQWIEDNPNGMSPVLAHQFTLRAAEAGIRVFWLVIPMADAMEAERSSASEELVEAALDLGQQHSNIRLLHYSGSNDLDRYCDFVHFNDKGEEEFSRWLASRLVDDTSPAVAGN